VRMQMHEDSSAFLQKCSVFRAAHEAQQQQAEGGAMEMQQRINHAQSRIANAEVDLATVKARLQESEKRSAALNATCDGEISLLLTLRLCT
jgi:hypothetical protein